MRFEGDWTPQSSAENMTGCLGHVNFGILFVTRNTFLEHVNEPKTNTTKQVPLTIIKTQKNPFKVTNSTLGTKSGLEESIHFYELGTLG